MSLWIDADRFHVGLRNLLSDDWAELDFTGRIVVPDKSVSEFVDTGRRRGYVDFYGTPRMYFRSIEQSGFGSMGASYIVSVEYGYEPVVASVPLPATAVLTLGAVAGLFGLSRGRRSALTGRGWMRMARP